ncbi:MAG: heme biosynthesis protein HemY, partial [Pseudomonadota bacterium]
GLEAHKLAPEFAPAAVVAAEAAFRMNETRRGVKVLETTWRKQPHPDVALAYVNARPGDSAADRLKRAQRLSELKPNNTESNLIVAQIAMEASEFKTARKAVAAVLRDQPRESAFMLMADIEDAETGNQGKVREWLSRAVRAQRDPAWTSDGYVSEKWAPFSPITGKLDAFEWKVPVEKIGGAMIENDLDPMEPGLMATEVEKDLPEAPTSKAEVIVTAKEAAPVTEEAEPIETHEVKVVTPTSDGETKDGSQSIETHDVKIVTATPNGQMKEKAVSAQPKADSADSNQAEEADEDDTIDAEVIEEVDDEIKVPIPDDPGVAGDEEKPAEKRFRLF